MKKKIIPSKLSGETVILNPKGYIQNSCNTLEIFYRKCSATNSASLYIAYFFRSCNEEKSSAFLSVYSSSFCIVDRCSRRKFTVTLSTVVRVPHLQWVICVNWRLVYSFLGSTPMNCWRQLPQEWLCVPGLRVFLLVFCLFLPT